MEALLVRRARAPIRPPEAERAGEILRANHVDATVVLRDRMNHHFERFPDRVAAFREAGGEYDEEAAHLIAAWIRNHTQ